MLNGYSAHTGCVFCYGAYQNWMFPSSVYEYDNKIYLENMVVKGYKNEY